MDRAVFEGRMMAYELDLDPTLRQVFPREIQVQKDKSKADKLPGWALLTLPVFASLTLWAPLVLAARIII